MKRVNSLARVAVGGALLALIATGCNVEREWITSRDPSEAEAQEEMQEQAAFFDIEGSPELDRAAREYQDYVDGQSELLVDRTEGFVAAVKTGDVAEAKSSMRLREYRGRGSSRSRRSSEPSIPRWTPGRATSLASNGPVSTG